jgi:alpha-tubulin suppressor-like RCC1 family protein
MSRAWSAGLVVVLTVSCTEFPNEPTKTVSVRPASAAWTQEWFVRDTGTLTIEVMLPDSTPVAGLNVEWQSDDPAVLEVTEIAPSDSSSRDSSLTVQLRAKATALARGRARVTVVIEGGGAFEHVQDTATITVHERWLAISAGATHTCAIAADSSAYCWGAGETGALGNGIPLASPVPQAVLMIGATKFLLISAGDDNSCGVITQGVAYCWGLGSLGRLGTGSQTNAFVPAPVTLGRVFDSLSAGQTSCGVSHQSAAFCWGMNEQLQLGTPLPQSALDVCGAVRCSLKPLAVWLDSGDTLSFSSVAVGTFHTCGLSSDSSTTGWALCWGSGIVAPLPEDTVFLLGDSLFKRQDPVPVAAPQGTVQRLRFKSIGVGDKHTCGVTISGNVYCWGRNDRGQLGSASRTNRAKPIGAAGFGGFESVVAGYGHTCGRTTDGAAYCWGANDYGQLGVDSISHVDRLSPAGVLGGHTFLSITAGNYHTCAIVTGGAAYCWGDNSAGQLGTTLTTETCTVLGRTKSCSLVPRRVADPMD